MSGYISPVNIFDLRNVCIGIKVQRKFPPFVMSDKLNKNRREK